ncbi:signal transduction histidine kinase [Stella humosa]|uniref:histidine kinase n=1 Tax=Stella humosa TaxID=94 RepID=A0A3N1MCB3_9PROT|nr:HAMP domain-containing sensor histidine kinase [Stella humosa]ROQ00390.1 signal transduction histidine kinase [Stella humosa]BBK30367.1 hypothetical protein STHU_10010 [Stella humosa]
MIRPGSLVSWLPPAARLPAIAGAAVFVVAVATTQIALHLQAAATDSQFQRLGEVYLDGLTASVRPSLEAGDGPALEARFRLAFGERQGVTERGLFAFAADGQLLASHTDSALPATRAAATRAGHLELDHATGLAWVARPVDDGRTGRLVAALDLGQLLADRRRLALGLVLLDLALAAGCAALAYWGLARIGRPIAIMLDRLHQASVGPPAAIPDAALAAADRPTAALMTAFNAMADSLRERQRMADEAAEREQAAALGRLAATMAHEVRNPLAGLATAVSTLKRFGDDGAVRAESLGLLERGIDAIDRIVTSSLGFYRPTDERRLGPADFADLEQLVRPAADRAGVGLDWRIELPDTVALGAVGVRQVLLNLLLNACAATAPGGTVALRAAMEGGELVCTIVDGGGGLDTHAARLLEQGGIREPGSGDAGGGDRGSGGRRRLGMAVVIGLLGDLDGRASVESEPGRGTSIRIAIPLRDEP